MKHQKWTEDDSRKANHIWEEYKSQHNITDRVGQTVDIDLKSKQIWFGDSTLQIVQRRLAEGLTSPLFFERIGFSAYLCKGGRR